MNKSEAQKMETTEAPEAAAPAGELTPEQIANLQEEVAKAKDNWIRTAADFDNFKKRAARERLEAAQYANATLLQKLLPILDNFEMALSAAQNVKDEKTASLRAGITMIQQQLKGILLESGLEEIDATGKTFDPTLHEAISQQESADIPEGQVLQQVRKGYKLKDRLLRPANVIVAKAPAENPK
ncbi:MAG TPA: nucleotide exchange factor GrpE [Verrucomicrobiae bacterium]|nr:nucleotide exchange factor GrpE [Verrucomicrobiae bacterium]